MLKKLFVAVMGLIGASEASAGPIKAFLDKEQRPGAQVITESFVDYDYKDETVFVQGVLGAIESERNPGSYVAFSGVELKSELFYLKDDGSSLAFELSSISNVLVLTVQMILADGELFALDLNLNNENKNDDFKISLDSFKESFRGRHGDKVFKGKFSDVASVRFFLKRSENSPEQKKPLDFSFNLKNLRFED